MNWKCPNGCKITEGVVCGGDYPFWARDEPSCEICVDPGEWKDYPYMYILMDLESGNFIKKVYGGSAGLDLNDRDWKELFEHAEAGCASEPMCPKCLEHLVEES